MADTIEDQIEILRSEAATHANDPGFGKLCAEMLLQDNKDRLLAAFIETAGFGTEPPLESFRRLELLRSLQPGAFCINKTWGFGVVQAVDDFYKRITIDFRRKRGHQLTLSYAVEAVTVVDSNHILAKHHNDPAAMAQLVAEQPDEVVRQTLTAFGAMPVSRLESILTEAEIIAPADWKSFWERARRALKNNSTVAIPQKKTEPIILVSGKKDLSTTLRERLQAERDIKTILELITEIEALETTVDQDTVAVIADRVAFAVKNSFNSDTANYARLTIIAARLKLPGIPTTDMHAHLLQKDHFISAAKELTAREAGELAHFMLSDHTAAQQRAVENITLLPHTILADTLQILSNSANSNNAAAACRMALSGTQSTPVLLYWALRNHDAFTDWELPGYYELLLRGINFLEEHHSGEALRMQNSVRTLFENEKWFTARYAAIEELQRRALFERVQASGIWEPAARHRMLQAMIKVDPKLSINRKSAPTQAVPQQRLTSWRSLRERQETYRKMVEVEMPQNNRDIAEARSYGDLRENFEYQAAKQQQATLLQRLSVMDADLRQVKGSDFAGAATDTVNCGTTVTYETADGTRSTYHILGEWDSNTELGIISNKSELARRLSGKQIGSQVEIPRLEGDVAAQIIAIEPLPETIRAWAKG